MSLVSIIIPVYNAQPYLAGTIESALKQTYALKEIIIVDDDSTDGSYELAKCFECDQVKVLRQPNAGAAVARNNGLTDAKGDYIQFLDAGDLLDSRKIEEQVLALNGSQDKIAVCNYVQFTNEAELKQAVYPDQSSFIYSSNNPVDFLVNLWGGNGAYNFIQTNCWLVPRALIEKGGNWRTYRCPDDDGEFFARMVLASEGIVYVPGVYNYYRMGPGANQLSSNTNLEYLKNTLLTIDLKFEYLKANGPHPGIRKAIATQYFRFAVFQYPQNKKLSKEAFLKYKSLQIKVAIPTLGGPIFYWIAKLFGWRAARQIRTFLRRP
jgi:glycosyltransferase involved in cell wall biosynthesis